MQRTEKYEEKCLKREQNLIFLQCFRKVVYLKQQVEDSFGSNAAVEMVALSAMYVVFY